MVLVLAQIYWHGDFFAFEELELLWISPVAGARLCLGFEVPEDRNAQVSGIDSKTVDIFEVT